MFASVIAPVRNRTQVIGYKSALRHPSRSVLVYSPHHHIRLYGMATATKETAALGSSGHELDVAQEIILDHNNVRDLYMRYVKETDRENKRALANTIIRELAVHGEAEEVSVYRRMDEEHMKEIAENSRHEHQELEEALYEFDQTSFDDPEHDARLKKAISVFHKHAQEEEGGILQKLQTKLSKEMNHKLATDFLHARQMVPHRPHPSAPNTGGLGQKLLGALAKPMDLAKETARSFVELRYQHPADATSGKPLHVDESVFA
ncbi:hypothetical protein CPB86DRAFT_778170 [Serendipita vermifera]|nr:hypothetical protein CPB86DRAFT_778170 [Serendipita vermifera]